jgi:ADP-ribosylglycohydrolase
MAGWTTLEELVSREFQQALEEGKSAAAVAALRSGFEGTHDADAVRALHAQLLALPVDPAFAFDEPGDLDAIRALRQGPLQFTPPPLDDALFDRLHGAWLGRCGGCALGKPVELIGLNPYREWIGAQIRVDSYAYAAPGDPALAADFAWRDARLSHTKNGIYGAMACAAMVAADFASDDVEEVVAAGLGEIPATSRVHGEMLQVVALCAEHGNDWDAHEAVFDGICALLGHYSAIHTNNNLAVIVASLLLSRGDYHRGITAAVMAGFDTDCNGATVGSILGAMNGAAKLPALWTARFNDTLKSGIVDYHPVAISECARRSMAILQKMRA